MCCVCVKQGLNALKCHLNAYEWPISNATEGRKPSRRPPGTAAMDAARPSREADSRSFPSRSFPSALFLPAARAVPAVGARASRWAGAFQNVLGRPCGRERGWALRSPRAWVRQLWAVRSSREALRNAGTPRILLVLRCRQVLLIVIVSAVNLTQHNALSSSCSNILSCCGMKDASECWGKKSAKLPLGQWVLHLCPRACRLRLYEEKLTSSFLSCSAFGSAELTASVPSAALSAVSWSVALCQGTSLLRGIAGTFGWALLRGEARGCLLQVGVKAVRDLAAKALSVDYRKYLI